MAGIPASRRILLLRPSALGDVCRTVPVLASLKRAIPEAHLGWVVQEGFQDAVRSHPDLDEIVLFPRKALARWATNPAVLMKSLTWMRSLRQGDWDVVIDCQGLGRSGLMAWASGAAIRIGDRHAREFGWLGYNHRVAIRRDQHSVDKMLKLLEAIDVPPIKDMRLYPPVESIQGWASLKANLGIECPYAVLATTTRWPSKAWPDDHWLSLLERLKDSSVDRFVLVGSPAERAKVRLLAARMSESSTAIIHDVSGRTSVGELMACIQESSVTISNDTAALHMAAGLGGRCVGLFGPTDPAIVGPYGLRSQVAYASPGRSVNYRDSHLGDSLMRPVQVDEVVDLVERLLAHHVQANNSMTLEGKS